MEMQFEKQGFGKRLKSMLKVDFKRMFTMPLIYIMAGVCFAMPILILVMTTAVSTAPANGVEAAADTFTNAWQSLGALSGAEMSMGLTSMCNINMIYFIIAILVSIFVADDFKSGYAKNLFTIRSKKSDYVISKTLVGYVGGAIMLLAYFVGAMIGGAIAGLSFDVGSAGASGIFMCIVSKILLAAVFVAIYLLVSVAAKQKLWLSILGSFAVSMLLFTMIPMITPLDSTVVNVFMCLAGGAIFAVGFGALSNLVLNKTALV
ncbi:MAG: ABC transporter permease [Clostridia bacterium]|nr:ABC transporter permease [Clostridia bacterium]MDE7215768.1 ABC transporter permease [Clostridia bacterium]